MAQREQGACFLIAVLEAEGSLVFEEADLCNDQIWFRIRTLPGIYFGGVYLPPTDSSYFDASAIASIRSRSFANPDMLFVCFGDINARFGMTTRNLISEDTSLTYKPIDLQLNARGQEMLQLCEDCKLLPVNNLEI